MPLRESHSVEWKLKKAGHFFIVNQKLFLSTCPCVFSIFPIFVRRNSKQPPYVPFRDKKRLSLPEGTSYALITVQSESFFHEHQRQHNISSFISKKPSEHTQFEINEKGRKCKNKTEIEILISKHVTYIYKRWIETTKWSEMSGGQIKRFHLPHLSSCFSSTLPVHPAPATYILYRFIS